MEESAFPVYMGVDVGTTKIAVVLLDTSTGEILKTHAIGNTSETTDQQGKARGWSEWDPKQTVDLTFKAMSEAASANKHKEIKGIGVTGQMHGMVLLDKDQLPLSPFIGWQDQRCNEKMHGENFTYIERMFKLAGKDGFIHEGCYPATGYMGSTLFWLKENYALPPKPAKACFLPDYLVMRMTGLGPVTDPSNAGGSGIYNIKSRKWDTELIQRLGLRSELLPEVKHSGELIGSLTSEAAQKTGLKEQTPVCVACGDNQASFLGSVANRGDAALVNIGTGGQISLWTQEHLSIEGLDTRCYLDESYMLVGASLCGGASYALLNKFFNEVGHAFFGTMEEADLNAEMTRLASKVPPGADGLRCEPLFTGTRLNPKNRAIWHGISESNFTPGHMARSLLEGAAEQFRILYDCMLEGGVQPREYLIGSGNAIRRNLLLTKILSYTFNMPIRIPKSIEEAAFGAALLAAVGCGEFRDLEEAAHLIVYG